MKKPTLLLDIDGTLVDSNGAHTHSWVEALTEHGFSVDDETIRVKIGMGGDKLLPLVTGVEAESDLGKKISERRAEIFKNKYLPHLQAFPKTHELLRHMIAEGYQLVVATSASMDDLKAILEQTGLEDLLTEYVTSDDADNSKPDPDILQAAMKKMNVSPQDAFMIGDTPYDMEAAKKANVRAIGFTSGGWNRQSLSYASAVYDGCAELLKNFSQSPLVQIRDRRNNLDSNPSF